MRFARRKEGPVWSRIMPFMGKPVVEGDGIRGTGSGIRGSGIGWKIENQDLGIKNNRAAVKDNFV